MQHPQRTFCIGLFLLILGLAVAYSVHTQNGDILVSDVRFKGEAGQILSGLLYAPKGAAQRQPAPAVLAVHGYINSRETQSGFAIEFARRGYIVLSLDQTGHGYSEPPAFSAGFGAPAALAYLRGLAITDNENIALEGHSMGGWAVLAAAASAPDDYRSMVIVGSATGVFGAPQGTPSFPRNLAVVFSEYDEFSELMWGVQRGRDIVDSAPLQRLFNTQAAVQRNKLYGNIESGTARLLTTPPVTHPGDHISRAAIGSAIDWLQRTLDGGHALPASDQVWMWKEAGTLVALIGFVVMLAAGGVLLLNASWFASLAIPPAISPPESTWGRMATFVLVPIISYIPLFLLADKIIPVTEIVPQQLNNGLLLWLVFNAVIAQLLTAIHARRRAGRIATPPGSWLNGRELGQLALSAGYALLLVGVGYLLVQVIALGLLLDLRFWVFAIKPLASWQYSSFVTYLLPVLVYFVILLGSLNRQLPLGDSLAVTIRNCFGLLCSGFVAFLLIQYGGLYVTGMLPLGQPLLTILAMQFLVVLSIAAILIAVLLPVTRQVYPAAFVCALLVTWIVVAGQATHA